MISNERPKEEDTVNIVNLIKGKDGKITRRTNV